jgi:hypothetical protein
MKAINWEIINWKLQSKQSTLLFTFLNGDRYLVNKKIKYLFNKYIDFLITQKILMFEFLKLKSIKNILIVFQFKSI